MLAILREYSVINFVILGNIRSYVFHFLFPVSAELVLDGEARHATAKRIAWEGIEGHETHESPGLTS